MTSAMLRPEVIEATASGIVRIATAVQLPDANTALALTALIIVLLKKNPGK